MTTDNIVSRLSRLERSNRRLRLAFVIATMALVASIFLGAEKPSAVISAESFKVVDSEGRTRGGFGQNKQGSFFFLNDETGKLRMSFAAQIDQSYVALKDDKDVTRVLVTLDDTGPGFYLRDDSAAPMASLATDKQGPLLNLREAGKSRVLTTISDVISEERRPGN